MKQLSLREPSNLAVTVNEFLIIYSLVVKEASKQNSMRKWVKRMEALFIIFSQIHRRFLLLQIINFMAVFELFKKIIFLSFPYESTDSELCLTIWDFFFKFRNMIIPKHNNRSLSLTNLPIFNILNSSGGKFLSRILLFPCILWSLCKNPYSCQEQKYKIKKGENDDLNKMLVI